MSLVCVYQLTVAAFCSLLQTQSGVYRTVHTPRNTQYTQTVTLPGPPYLTVHTDRPKHQQVFYQTVGRPLLPAAVLFTL